MPCLHRGQYHAYDLAVRLALVLRDRHRVQIHRGANVGVAHEFLLEVADCRLGRASQPRDLLYRSIAFHHQAQLHRAFAVSFTGAVRETTQLIATE